MRDISQKILWIDKDSRQGEAEPIYYLLLTIDYLGWGSFDSAFGLAQDFRFASACAND